MQRGRHSHLSCGYDDGTLDYNRSAKEKRLGLYGNIPTTSNGSNASNGTHSGSERIQFDAQVVRIWSGDQIVRGFKRLLYFRSQILAFIVCRRKRHHKRTPITTKLPACSAVCQQFSLTKSGN